MGDDGEGSPPEDLPACVMVHRSLSLPDDLQKYSINAFDWFYKVFLLPAK
jgi:hypothetical protein